METYFAIGKRKAAISKVSIIKGSGLITINKQNNIIPNSYFIEVSLRPLKILNKLNEYDITILLKGGGIHSQMEATRLALSRCLCLENINNRKILKVNKFLKRDSRIKERRKYGLKKARKAPQYSKR